MTLSISRTIPIQSLAVPVSFRDLDAKLTDCRNIINVRVNESGKGAKNVTETRYGLKRYNSTAFSGKIISGSFFKKTDGTRYKIVKIGTELFSVTASGSTSIKSGLTTASKHYGVTFGDRHIITVENDGVFQWDGTTFTKIGQAIGSAPNVAASGSGNTLTAGTYKVGYTFFSSVTGFESNISSLSSSQTVTSGQKLDISAMPTTAANATIDKKRVYLQDFANAGALIFVDEINLADATYSITADPTSTRTPPTRNAPPVTTGISHMTDFDESIVLALKKDVLISEPYQPDAYDDSETDQTITISGQGVITGVAKGMMNVDESYPYLVIFTRNSISIFSRAGGISRLDRLDGGIGCVSASTIAVENGIVYFMSDNGWYRIINSQLERDPSKDMDAVTLGRGDIDDIFTRVGWNYQLNTERFSDHFSLFFPTHNQYITFVSESGNSEILKAYVYERGLGGFRIWDFKYSLTCGFVGEDDSGDSCFFVGNEDGYLFTYSVKNDRSDQDNSGNSVSIPVYVLMPWFYHPDLEASTRWKRMFIRGLSSSNAITARFFKNYVYGDYDSATLDLMSSSAGFTLDVSQLDVDVFGPEREIIWKKVPISITSRSLLIGFYQDIADSNLGIIDFQVQGKKNGK